MTDAFGKEQPRTLTLDKTALSLWQDFAQHIEHNQVEGQRFETMSDWTGKLPGAALRIAGLCHLVEHGISQPVINHDTIDKAIKLCQLLIPHAEAAFDLMGSNQMIEDAKYLLRWIIAQNKPMFYQRDAHCAPRFKGEVKVERILSALESLKQRNITTNGRWQKASPLSPS